MYRFWDSLKCIYCVGGMEGSAKWHGAWDASHFWVCPELTYLSLGIWRVYSWCFWGVVLLCGFILSPYLGFIISCTSFLFFFWVSLMCFCILFIVTFLVTVFNFLVIYCFRLTVSVLCLSWLCSPLSPPVSTLAISLLYINSPAFPLSYSVCVFFLCVIFFFWFYYMWNIDIKYH